MGCFDGITDATFKTDRAGNTVFYPWGVFGRGYVLTDPATIDRARLFIRRWYQGSLLGVPVFVLLNRKASPPLAIGSALVVGLIAIGWFALKSREFTAGTDISDERLSLREAHATMAARFSRGLIWGFFVISLAIIGLGVWIAVALPTTFGIATGLSLSILCVFTSLQWARILTMKNRQPPQI